MAGKDPKEYPFQCDICGERFKLEKALGSHKSYRHGIAGTPRTKEGWERQQKAQRLREVATTYKSGEGPALVKQLLAEVERLKGVERQYNELLESLELVAAEALEYTENRVAVAGQKAATK